MCACVCVYIYISIRVCVYIYMPICIDCLVEWKYESKCEYKYVFMCVSWVLGTPGGCVCVCLYVCMYLYMCVTCVVQYRGDTGVVEW